MHHHQEPAMSPENLKALYQMFLSSGAVGEIIEPRHLITHLFLNNVITNDAYELIHAPITRHERQKVMFMDLMPNYGENGLLGLLKALEELRLSPAADFFKQNSEKLKVLTGLKGDILDAKLCLIDTYQNLSSTFTAITTKAASNEESNSSINVTITNVADSKETFQDYMQLVSDKNAGKRIVVYGDAGIGKTTVLQKIIMDWSRQEGPDGLLLRIAMQFHHLFYVSCNDLRDKKIEDAVLEQCKSSSPSDLEAVKSILRSKEQSISSHILFLLDDFSEGSSRNYESNELRDLLQCNTLPFATVLVTCRPNVLHKLKTRTLTRNTVTYCATGFDKDAQIAFMLKRKIKDTQNICGSVRHTWMESVLSNPFFLDMLCKRVANCAAFNLHEIDFFALVESHYADMLARYKKQTSMEISKEKESKLVDFLMKKAVVEMYDTSGGSFEELHAQIDTIQMEEELQKCSEEQSLAEVVGFIANGNFPHMIFMEYLAAKYYHKKNILPSSRFLKKCGASISPFLYFLTGFSDQFTQKVIQQAIITSDGTKSFFRPFLWVSYKHLGTLNLSIPKLDIAAQTQLSKDVCAKVLSHTKELRSVILKRNAGGSSYNIDQKLLEMLSKISTLDSLSFSDCTFEFCSEAIANFYAAIGHRLISMTMQNVDLHLVDDGRLTSYLSKFVVLQKLKLVNANLWKAHVFHLQEAFQKAPLRNTLRSLILSSNRAIGTLDNQEQISFLLSIMSLPKLRKVHVLGSNVSPVAYAHALETTEKKKWKICEKLEVMSVPCQDATEFVQHYPGHLHSMLENILYADGTEHDRTRFASLTLGKMFRLFELYSQQGLGTLREDTYEEMPSLICDPADQQVVDAYFDILKMSASFTALRAINLAGCKVSEKAVDQLVLILGSDSSPLRSTVRKLKLSMNSSCDNADLAKAIMNLDNLQTLELSNCSLNELTYEFTKGLAEEELYLGFKMHLENLDVSRNFRVGEAVVFAERLGRFVNLKSLNLGFCQLTQEFLEMLARSFADRPVIETLDITGTRNVPMVFLQSMCANLHGLKHLTMAFCTLKVDEDSENLTQAITNFRFAMENATFKDQLVSFNASGMSQIGDQDSFISVLCEFPLKKLKLDYCCLTKDSILQFCAKFADSSLSKSLEVLSLMCSGKVLEDPELLEKLESDALQLRKCTMNYYDLLSHPSLSDMREFEMEINDSKSIKCFKRFMKSMTDERGMCSSFSSMGETSMLHRIRRPTSVLPPGRTKLLHSLHKDRLVSSIDKLCAQSKIHVSFF